MATQEERDELRRHMLGAWWRQDLGDNLTAFLEWHDAKMRGAKSEAIREYAAYLDATSKLHDYVMDEEDWKEHAIITSCLRNWADYIESDKHAEVVFHEDCEHGGTFADYRECLEQRAAALGVAGTAQVDQFDAWHRNVQDWHLFETRARIEADRRVAEGDGLDYDMEVEAFVAGALWARDHQDKH